MVAIGTGCVERVTEPGPTAGLASKRAVDDADGAAWHPITWSDLPTFELPFAVVYEGPVVGGPGTSVERPLRHGFSHVGWMSADPASAPELAPEDRAVVWTGIVTADGAGNGKPWHKDSSPWGNDLSALRKNWDARGGFYRKYFGDEGGGLPDVDLLVIDVEANLEDRDDILKLRSTSIPESMKRLDDDVLVRAYSRDMRDLYYQALAFVEQRRSGPMPRLSSYADVPIRRTWHDIPDNTWNEWRTDSALASRLVLDRERPEARSEFFGLQDFISPSAYFFYDFGRHDVRYAGRYLAYLLFQVEANKAWTDKDVMLFGWLRFVGSNNYGEPIADFMAESLAIFPFMAGANGLWLWENGEYKQLGPDDDIPPYDVFIRTLYRLSRYASFFDGPVTYVAPDNPRDLFSGYEPVWRGVVKGDSILVAAQNPYAAPGEATRMTVGFDDWTHEIELRGRGAFLSAFPLR